MNLRDATPADLPTMLALERNAPTAAHWSEADYRRIFDPAQPRRIALVIEGEDVLGFLVARLAASEAELENVVVAASAQRRGLGARLLGELLRRAGGLKVFLEVRESNLPARRLYENHGFALEGRRSGYYSAPAEDALVYVSCSGRRP